MPAPRRFHAPTENGEVLADPGFDAVPDLVAENRRRLDRSDVIIGGMPLRELRELAKREALLGATEPVRAPVLLAGHQPELSHPGVWVKNFALNGLARKIGGVPLNLIVDNDTLKSTSLRFPTFRAGNPASVHLQSLPFDAFDGEYSYEDRGIRDQACFASFADRAAPVWANWGYEPLLATAWPEVVAHTGRSIGAQFAGVRHAWERRWGCVNHELPVSQLTEMQSFSRFARHILADLPRFREVYNAAIQVYRVANGVHSKNHPAPELAPNEAPFWAHTRDGQRKRATPATDLRTLRPRALTLTLFGRVCLGDFFIHGIGGGKYDEVTDTIIRNYFGVEPPAYQVLSATLHLPLPGFPSTDTDVWRAEQLVRDLHWNPQRHITTDMLARPDIQSLVAEKAALVANEPPQFEHAERQEWFRALQSMTERLRPFVAEQTAPAEAALALARVEAAANATLRRRDFAWVHYPEETLRPFLQRFLTV